MCLAGLVVAIVYPWAGVSVRGGQNAEQRIAPGEVKWPTGGPSLVGTSGVSGIQTVILKSDQAALIEPQPAPTFGPDTFPV